MTDIDQLRNAVDLLQQAYDDAREQIAVWHPEPLRVMTADGHYVLLDALTALVHARTILAQVENWQPQ